MPVNYRVRNIYDLKATFDWPEYLFLKKKLEIPANRNYFL